MAYLLDTDWAVHAIAGQRGALATLNQLAGGRIYFSYISVAELFEGAFNSSNPQARLVTFRHFLSALTLLNLNDGISERFAEIRASLRRRGMSIGDFDLMIAATALHFDLTLLTFNLRHFQRIPDLKMYQPT
jgi:tRNA(fMet)-specific endonuclease VapC